MEGYHHSLEDGQIRSTVSARAVIISPEKEVLMVSNSHGSSGTFTLPGGRAQTVATIISTGVSTYKSEAPHETLLREIYEELGIVAKIISLGAITAGYCQKYKSDKLEFYFLVRYEDAYRMPPSGTHSHEIKESAWIPISDIANHSRVKHPSISSIIAHMSENIAHIMKPLYYPDFFHE